MAKSRAPRGSSISACVLAMVCLYLDCPFNAASDAVGACTGMVLAGSRPVTPRGCFPVDRAVGPGRLHLAHTDASLRLRGSGDDSEDEDEGVEVFRTVEGHDLEPMPCFSLRTPDQEPGVDYGAYGFMFNIANIGPSTVLISGLQICSGDGTPHNYAVYTSAARWQEAQNDPSAWKECGGGRRLYIPDHEHGVYGKLPMAPVEIAPQETRAIFIHGDDDCASVGYRMIGDEEEAQAFTDKDDNIQISSGRRSTSKYPFPTEGLEPLDDIVRGFLGIVEYEIDDQRR